MIDDPNPGIDRDALMDWLAYHGVDVARIETIEAEVRRLDKQLQQLRAAGDETWETIADDIRKLNAVRAALMQGQDHAPLPPVEIVQKTAYMFGRDGRDD